MYLPHFGVHAPHEAKQELIDKFRRKSPVGGHHDPTYAAMIASVDESVGRVLATLDELNLAENTLVIFSSDNGGVGGYRSVGLDKEGITDNAPLKGGKGTLAEGGIRVPYIFRWKGTIQPGRTDATPINSVDLYPTLIEVAGAQTPVDYPLDGRSYLQLLKGTGTMPEREAIFWHFPGYLGAGANQWRTKPVSVVRAGDWKLLEYFEEGRLELYNLKHDVSERQNLAADEPGKTAELHEMLKTWRNNVGAKMPMVNKKAQDETNPKGNKKQRNRNQVKQEDD